MLFKTFNTFEIPGRLWGSWSQQCCTSDHNPSVRVGCVGRGGRFPPIIAIVAAVDRVSLNGTAPVNAWGDARWR